MFQHPHSTVTMQNEDSGEILTLDYYLTEDDLILSETMSVVTFGAAIQLYRNGKTEHCTISSLFTDKASAEEFIECLAKNYVTPATLLDVAEDYLAEPITREVNVPAMAR